MASYDTYEDAFREAYNNYEEYYGEDIDLKNLEYSVHPIDHDIIFDAACESFEYEITEDDTIMPFGIPLKESNFVGPGCVILHIGGAIIGVASLN